LRGGRLAFTAILSPFAGGRISWSEMRRVFLLCLIFLPTRAAAQDALTLADAITAARTGSPAVRASRAAEGESAARVQEADAGWWPRVDFAESWQHGNIPVYVFGSLLSQRRFTEANFAVDSLNNPDALTNHRASLAVSQPLFASEVLDGRRAARIGRDLATAGRDAIERDVIVQATTAFGQALVAQAAHSLAL